LGLLALSRSGRQSRVDLPTGQHRFHQESTVLQQRSIPLYVILTLVTCGIWGIVWFFQLGGDIQSLRGDGKPSPGTDFLLTIVTCGLWGIYVSYQWPTLLIEPLRARGRQVDSNLPVMSLVLTLFGLNIVGWVLMQQLLNDEAVRGGQQ
jgi:hypothetical protein